VEASPPWSTVNPSLHKEFAFFRFQFVFDCPSAPRQDTTFILNLARARRLFAVAPKTEE